MQLHTALRASFVALCSARLPKLSPGLFGLRPSNLLWLRHRRRDSSVSVVFFRRIPFCSRTPSTPRGYPNSPPGCLAYALRISYGFAIEGEIPPQSHATPYGTPCLFRCALLRCGRKNSLPDCFSSALRISSEQIKKVCIKHTFFIWRRRRDSNSRTVLPVTRFPIARARPTTRLLHSSFLVRVS